MNDSFHNRFPLAHTFSIVARDLATGQMGVAVQSHWFSVGSMVTWAEAGVGAVATQSMVEPSYGPLGLTLMRAGLSAPAALAALTAADSRRELRQVAMVDNQGRVAVHTGTRCIGDAGHVVGVGFSTQANMMANPSVWSAMADAFRHATGDLADRMLVALEAAQIAGGDLRGQQSAAILIVKPVSTGRPWADRVMELRVEDHPEPVEELKRLVGVQRAYELMNTGDDCISSERFEDALLAYRSAAQLVPDIEELPFWQAVTMAEIGRLEEALPIFHQVFEINPVWRTMVQRLPPSGLLRDDPEMMGRILAA